jgi:copper chaperone CopZ
MNLFLILVISLLIPQHYLISKEKTVTLNVYGMSCSGCENKIEEELMKSDGIKSVKADHTRNLVTVKYDNKKITLKKIKEIIKNTGYKTD